MSSLSYRLIYIGDAPAGLQGLDELFNNLFEGGNKPDDPNIDDKLINGVRQHNYIPKPAINEYKEVLLREYRRYYQQSIEGETTTVRDYGQWQGYPREHIPWFPTVSAELCNGCGKCIEICPKGVFEKTEEGKVEVVEPFLCIVGCCFCKSACEPEAILMPNKEMLDQYRHGQRQAR